MANELMAVRKDIWRYKREAEEAKVNLRKVVTDKICRSGLPLNNCTPLISRQCWGHGCVCITPNIDISNQIESFLHFDVAATFVDKSDLTIDRSNIIECEHPTTGRGTAGRTLNFHCRTRHA